MNINKNSFHYQLAKFASDGSVPNNLCAYFWLAVSGAFLYFLLVLVVVGIAFCIVSIGLAWWSSAFQVPAFIGGVLSAAGLFAFLMMTIEERKTDERLASWGEDTIPAKEPNLVIAYLKAKKEKVCPILTFV